MVFKSSWYKVAIVLIGFALEFTVEFEAGVVGGSQEVREERRQCLEHGILRTEREKRDQPKFEREGRDISGTHAFGFMVGSLIVRHEEQKRGLEKSQWPIFYRE